MGISRPRHPGRGDISTAIRQWQDLATHESADDPDERKWHLLALRRVEQLENAIVDRRQYVLKQMELAEDAHLASGDSRRRAAIKSKLMEKYSRIHGPFRSLPLRHRSPTRLRARRTRSPQADSASPQRSRSGTRRARRKTATAAKTPQPAEPQTQRSSPSPPERSHGVLLSPPSQPPEPRQERVAPRGREPLLKGGQSCDAHRNLHFRAWGASSHATTLRLILCAHGFALARSRPTVSLRIS